MGLTLMQEKQEEARAEKLQEKTCQECEANKAEFVLVNGQEKENLCSICIQERVFSLIKDNEQVTFKKKLNVIEVG